MMEPIGQLRWAIAAGFMPLGSTGEEPAFTSRDQVAILNAGDTMAVVLLTLHYTDRAPVEPYRVTVAPRRVRPVRINDLIFPEAPPLETPYALIADSDVPVVVQFTRQDTRQAANALLGTIAWTQD